MQKALYAFVSASLRGLSLSISFVLFVLAMAASLPLIAQDDLTTQNATSGYNGAFITGPASNPLSFLNGAAWRTTGNPAPYDFHDFAPATYLDSRLPNWFDVQAEERFRYEGYDNNGFKAGANDSYLLNRLRLQADLHTPSWFRVTTQVQDARARLPKAANRAAKHCSLGSQVGVCGIWRPGETLVQPPRRATAHKLQQHDHCQLGMA